MVVRLGKNMILSFVAVSLNFCDDQSEEIIFVKSLSSIGTLSLGKVSQGYFPSSSSCFLLRNLDDY